MKWVSSLLSQFSRPISIRYLHSQSRARIYTARVACYSKIFFRLANFTRQFWRVEIRFLSEQWTTEITHPGDDPHFLPNWISNESLWRHEQIVTSYRGNFLQFDESNCIQNDSIFLFNFQNFSKFNTFLNNFVGFSACTFSH